MKKTPKQDPGKWDGERKGLSATLTVNLTGLGATFLQGAWTAGAYTDDPSARVAFGVFGAQPREFIFQRENY